MASIKRVLFAISFLVVASYAKSNGQQIDLKIPEACNKKGFCSIRPEGYDELEERINELLSPHLIESFADRSGELPQSKVSPKSDWHNCAYRTEVHSSYLYNNESKVDIIVQSKLLTQSIETVQCEYEKINEYRNNNGYETESPECFGHFDLLKNKVSCQTTTVKRPLLVYDAKKDSMKIKYYEVPCCCTCKIKN